MKHREHQRWILLLLGDRREHPDAAVAEFKNGFANLTLLIPDFDSVEPLDFYLFHLIGDGVVAFSCKPVDTGPHQKMSPGIVGYAEQFVDVALAISDVDDSLWVGEQRRRLPQVFQPAIALLLLDRYTSGIDAALERIRAMELVPGPELDGGQPERKAIPRHHKTGMHQNSACHLMHDADRFGVLAVI